MPSLFRISAGKAGPGASSASLAACPGSGAFTSATLGNETCANSVACCHSPTCRPSASAASPRVARRVRRRDSAAESAARRTGCDTADTGCPAPTASVQARSPEPATAVSLAQAAPTGLRLNRRRAPTAGLGKVVCTTQPGSKACAIRSQGNPAIRVTLRQHARHWHRQMASAQATAASTALRDQHDVAGRARP